MLRFLGRRALQIVPVLILASLALFLILRVLPGDPARRQLGTQASQEQVDVLRERLGLERPVLVQYVDWLGGAVRGDLGESFGDATPVTSMVLRALPVTLTLTISALILALIVAIPIAIVGATRPGGFVDGFLTFVGVLSTSVPTFVWSLTFILLFSLFLRLLPSSGWISPFEDPVGALRSLILPVIALSLPSIGVLARVGRTALLETMGEPSMQFARAKGLGQRRLLYVHALKPASIAIASVAGIEFAYLLGDSVAVEWVFSLPGLGKLMLDAFLQREYLVIQGVAFAFIICVLVSSLVTDVAVAELDPRMREEVVGARSR